MTDQHPLPWLIAIGVVWIMAVDSPSLMVQGVLAIGLTLMLRVVGRQRPFPYWIVAALLLYWVCLILVLPGPKTGAHLFTRPVWNVGPGVRFGGPLKLDAVTLGLVSALRVINVVLAGITLMRCVAGPRWHALFSGLLGGKGMLLAPWCYLGSTSPGTRRNEVALRRAGEAPFVGKDTVLIRWLRLPIILLLTAGPLLVLAINEDWWPLSGVTTTVASVWALMALGALWSTHPAPRVAYVVLGAAGLLALGMWGLPFLLSALNEPATDLVLAIALIPGLAVMLLATWMEVRHAERA